MICVSALDILRVEASTLLHISSLLPTTLLQVADVYMDTRAPLFYMGRCFHLFLDVYTPVYVSFSPDSLRLCSLSSLSLVVPLCPPLLAVGLVSVVSSATDRLDDVNAITYAHVRIYTCIRICIEKELCGQMDS